MKKNLFFLFILLFFSCSQKDIVIVSDTESIKSKIVLKDKNSFWTEPLEEEILQKDITKVQDISDNIQPSVEAINSLSHYKNELYPYIKDLGSLDNTLIDKELDYFLTSFCNNLIKGNFTDLASFFDDDYLFNLIFFEQDIKSSYKTILNTKYKEKSPFITFLVCSPLDNFDLIEVPIRLKNTYGFIDIKLFIGNNKKKYLIKSIDILGGAKKNANE